VVKKYRFYYASREGKMSNHVKYSYDTMLQGIFLEKNGANEYHQQFASTDIVVARQALSEKLCKDVRALEEQGRRYEALQIAMQVGILEGTAEKLLPRFFRIFGSVAGDLYSSMLENLVIQRVLQNAVQNQLWNQLSLCKEQFAKYKDRLFALCFTKESSEMIEISFGISNIIRQITEDGKLKVDGNTIRSLAKIYDLCEAALLSMLDDILIWFPPIQAHLNSCLERSGHQHIVMFEPQRTTRSVDIRREEERLAKEGTTPIAITKEATLLQYAVDSNLDVWIEDMLVDVYSTIIPPNPFPTVVHRLRQLAFRLLLKDRSLLEMRRSVCNPNPNPN